MQGRKGRRPLEEEKDEGEEKKARKNVTLTLIINIKLIYFDISFKKYMLDSPFTS